AALRAEHGYPATRLLVVASPELQEGATIELSAPIVVGRDSQGGIRLDRDEFASAQHARIEPRANGAWVDDLGSTNGTFVNGAKLKKGRIAKVGDGIKIGGAELRGAGGGGGRR